MLQDSVATNDSCARSAFWLLFYVMEAGAIMSILAQHGGDHKAAVPFLPPVLLTHFLPDFFLRCLVHDTGCVIWQMERACSCLMPQAKSEGCSLLWVQGKALSGLRTLPQVLLPESRLDIVRALVKYTRGLQVGLSIGSAW